MRANIKILFLTDFSGFSFVPLPRRWITCLYCSKDKGKIKNQGVHVRGTKRSKTSKYKNF